MKDNVALDSVKNYIYEPNIVYFGSRDLLLDKLSEHVNKCHFIHLEWDHKVCDNIEFASTQLIIFDMQITDDDLRFLTNKLQSCGHELFPIILIGNNPEDFHKDEHEMFVFVPDEIDIDHLGSMINGLVSYKTNLSETIEVMHELTDVGQTLRKAEFIVNSIPSAKQVAYFISQLFPAPESACIGLYELIINGIQYGCINSSIEFVGSSRKHEQAWEKCINKYLSINGRSVTVNFETSDKLVAVKIVDPGKGFDWKKYIKDSQSLYGKDDVTGILYATNKAFDGLKYNEKGNEVLAYCYKAKREHESHAKNI